MTVRQITAGATRVEFDAEQIGDEDRAERMAMACLDVCQVEWPEGFKGKSFVVEMDGMDIRVTKLD
jgi:hypothetical protein